MPEEMMISGSERLPEPKVIETFSPEEYWILSVRMQYSDSPRRRGRYSVFVFNKLDDWDRDESIEYILKSSLPEYKSSFPCTSFSRALPLPPTTSAAKTNSKRRSTNFFFTTRTTA